MKWRMPCIVWLVAILMERCKGRVLNTYFNNDCNQFFYHNVAPQGFPPQDNNIFRSICQTYQNREHYATYYDTIHRIPVYSAYISTRGSSGRQGSSWYIEPQLSNLNNDPNMYTETNNENQNQAFDADYRHVESIDRDDSIARGHLNPDLHNADPDKKRATYTLTNAVPKFSQFNSNFWMLMEKTTHDILGKFCPPLICTSYHVTGALVDDDTNWIPDNNNQRVAIPRIVWSAVCVVIMKIDDLGNPYEETFSFGYLGVQERGIAVPLVGGITMHSIESLDQLLTMFFGQPVEIFQNKCRSHRNNKALEEIAENLLLAQSDKINFKERSRGQNRELEVPCNIFNLIRPDSNFYSINLDFRHNHHFTLQFRPENYERTSQNLMQLQLGCNQLQISSSLTSRSRGKRSTEEYNHCIPQSLQSNTVTVGNTNCLDEACKANAFGVYNCYVSRDKYQERCCAPNSQCQQDKDGKYFWCYVVDNPHWYSLVSWSYCGPPYSAVTTKSVPCRDGHSCGLHGKSYYWCYTDDGGNWDYCCAPYSPCNDKHCYIVEMMDSSINFASSVQNCGDDFHPIDGAPRDELKRSVIVSGRNCPEDWVEFCMEQGKCFCYLYHDELKTWKESFEHCQFSNGGTLASIHSEEQLDFLNIHSGGTDFWTGLSAIDDDRKFGWTDGSDLDFTKWGKGQPDSSHGSHTCVLASSSWRDINCNLRGPFFCQIPFTLSKEKETINCAPDWTQFCQSKDNCACYIYVKKTMTWLDAADYCKSKDSYLPSIHSLEEASFLEDLTRNDAKLPWIGLKLTDGNFVWEDKTIVDFVQWGYSEPNNVDSVEHCTQMRTKGYFQRFKPDEMSESKKWNDCRCHIYQETFFCKTQLPQNIPECDYTQVICPQGWTRFCIFGMLCNCYLFNATQLTWEEANSVCVNQHQSHLASVESDTENTMFAYLLQGLKVPPAKTFGFYSHAIPMNAKLKTQAWMGLKGHQWSDGSPPKYENWMSGIIVSSYLSLW
jgi:DNA/RNA endonuclease G (NUC1)